MDDRRRKQADEYLAKARALLGFVPDIADGPIDEIVIGGLEALIDIIRELLQGGRSIEEIRGVLKIFVAAPLDRLDVDGVRDRILDELGLPPVVATADTEPAPE